MEVNQTDFDTKIHNALDIMGHELTVSMQKKLTKAHGKDTGKLKASIKYSIKNDEIDIRMLDYGRTVEYGQPIGADVDPKELEGWCERKLGDKGLAKAVADKIKLNGTRPYPFIRNTFNQEAKKIIKKALLEAFS